MRASIAGLGLWLPSAVRRNDAWPQELREAFERRTGDRTLVDVPFSTDHTAQITARHLARDSADPFFHTCERRIANAGTKSWQAEAAAASNALEDAGVEAREIDAVLSWSLVPERPAQPSAPKVAHAIGAERAWGIGADAGCASPLLQLEMAASLVESGRARCVLLTQSHLLTRAFPMSHPASPGIGDAATAILVAATEHRGILATHAVSHGEHHDAVAWVRGTDDASDSPWWIEGGPFVPGSRQPASAKHLMQHTVSYGTQTVRELCARAHVPISELEGLVSVQPRGWIPHAITEALELPDERTADTFRTLAHIGGCGVVANLLALRARGTRGPVALYAQGAGFTRAATLVSL